MLHSLIMLLALLISTHSARAQLLEKPAQKDAVIFTMPPEEEKSAAEKPDKTALAMQYFDRCMDTVYQDISEIARGDFCMCSASAASQTLSEEELGFMATGKNDDQIRYFDPVEFNAKLDDQINAPCIYLALRDIERAECLASDKIQHFFVSQNAYEVMCECLSGGIADFVRDYARDILPAVRKRYPDAADDPAAAIRQWSDYRIELGKVTKECLNMYSHK